MKKLLLSLVVIAAGVFIVYEKSYSMQNPWVYCGNDISCAAQKAGFNFPLYVKDYRVRAMKDMIEFEILLKDRRILTLRKTVHYIGNGDISGVYENYPVNKTVKLRNGVSFRVRGDNEKYYVVNFASESGYYSAYCVDGLKYKDIKYLYKILEQAEAPRFSYDEKDNYTIEQLRDKRRVDGIVEPVYTQDCFPRTLEKRGVTKECFERANLGQDTFCSASQIKMIKDYYKKGQQKDPLNNGSGQFCALTDS